MKATINSITFMKSEKGTTASPNAAFSNIKIKETNTKLMHSNVFLQSKLQQMTKQNEDLLVRASHDTKATEFKFSIFSPSKTGV
mgnify:CR=1 FL=1